MMMGSQSLVLATTATAMVLSSTVLFLAFSRIKPDHTRDRDKSLRSCLCSDEKRLGRKMKNKKKRVKFAESVKEPRNNGVEFRKRQHQQKSCGIVYSKVLMPGMPANRAALYSGILRDNRAYRNRMECSY